jgi:redox-sensing transcriptional repressor
VLTPPKPASAEIGRRLNTLPVGAVWNFTGVELNLIPEIILQNVHLGDSLMTLCYRLRQVRNEND